MDIRKLTKEELGAIVAFPRTILKGIGCEDKDSMPTRQDFNLRIVQDVPGMGEAKLIEQLNEPHMVFQLIEPKDEQEFDLVLPISRAAQTSSSCSRDARTTSRPHNRTTKKRCSSSAMSATRPHDGGTCMESEKIEKVRN